MSSNKLVDGLGRTSHVADLGYTQRFLCQYLVGVVTVQFILRSTGQIDVGLLLPWFLALKELAARKLVGIGLANIIARSTQLQQEVYLLVVKPCRVIDVTVRS